MSSKKEEKGEKPLPLLRWRFGKASHTSFLINENDKKKIALFKKSSS
jgi:hypothetical protein